VNDQVGFTAHTFSDDFSSLTTLFYNGAGHLLHTYKQAKGYRHRSGDGDDADE
jgi:hypothetical protein